MNFMCMADKKIPAVQGFQTADKGLDVDPGL